MAFLGVKPQVGPSPTLPAGLGSSCLGPTSLPATSPHRKSWIPGSQASISSHSSNTPPNKTPKLSSLSANEDGPSEQPCLLGLLLVGGSRANHPVWRPTAEASFQDSTNMSFVMEMKVK